MPGIELSIVRSPVVFTQFGMCKVGGLHQVLTTILLRVFIHACKIDEVQHKVIVYIIMHVSKSCECLMYFLLLKVDLLPDLFSL